jgi:hypothetical protein
MHAFQVNSGLKQAVTLFPVRFFLSRECSARKFQGNYESLQLTYANMTAVTTEHVLIPI